MNIQSRPGLRSALREAWRNRTRRGRILGVVFYTLVVFAFGFWFHRSGLFYESKEAIVGVRLLPNMIRGKLSETEHLTIDVKHKDFLKLAYQREVALAKRILESSDEDYVPAKIRYKDKTVKAKVRLKGDLVDHLGGTKWSFRIVLKGDNTLFGMKQFSIHHPKARNYISEWLYHEAMRREGIIGLRYDFIDVTLNGDPLGVYALEEHFEKRLIEHNRLREGPIIRFSEDLYWARWARGEEVLADEFFASDVDGFQTGRMGTDPAFEQQYLRAARLLESFRQGALNTARVFDVDKLAKFLALSDLLGASHGAANWTNVRFYYNPVTGLLEPIAFDGHHIGRQKPIARLVAEIPSIGTPRTDDGYYYVGMLFNDPALSTAYVRELERVSEPAYVERLLDDLRPEMDAKLNILHREFPRVAFSPETILANRAYIEHALNPLRGLQAHRKSLTPAGLEIEVANLQRMPIEVLNVSYRNSFLAPVEEAVVLPARDPARPVDYRSVSFTPRNGFAPDAEDTGGELTINYRILGSSRNRNEAVADWPRLDPRLTEGGLTRRPPNAREAAYVSVDEAAKAIRIRPGNWRIEHTLIVPAGYTLVAREGVRIDLTNGATILSRSPLDLRGSGDRPIVFGSTDGTGQGLVVVGATGLSTVEHVVFDNLANPSDGPWELPGAVTFYESPVNIANCRFVNNRSEDALNVIRAEFSIDSTLFRGIQSDAFDGDFTQGRITNSSFISTGNDAVDVSGSVIEVEDVQIEQAGDKGLSAGENSRLRATRVEIRGAAIAVASKDLSEIDLDGVSISGGQVGLTAFQKKPEFGPASITAVKLTLNGITVPYLIEERSRASVDGVSIAVARDSVEDVLYGAVYGKSSD